MKSLVGTVLNRAPIPYVSTAALNLTIPFRQGNDREAQMRAMGANGTLFAIVDKCASGAASVDWHLYRKARSGKPEDRTEVTAHAALDLINNPNRFYTRQELIETGQQHHELTGEMWWVIGRDPRSSLPLELWPVRPDRMEPVPSSTNYLAGYTYLGPDGETIPLGLDDVIFMRRPSPLDAYRGIGPVQAALLDIESASAAKAWNSNFFRNSAEPGGIVQIDRRLTDTEFREHQARWREQHQGVSAAHRVALLEGGMQWIERKYTQRDMQFVELRGVTREDIREAFGFPKPLLGAVDDVNRANAEAAEYVFAKWVLVPRLERIKGALNADLLPLFGTKDLEFDYDSPVSEDAETENAERTSKVAAFVQLITNGVEPTAAMEYAGLPDMDMSALADGDGGATASPRDIAEMVQKIYLGVGVVVTWEEAREVLVAAGANLDLTVPPPMPAEPAPAPGEESVGSGSEAPAAPPPGRRAPPAGRFRAAELPDDWTERIEALLAVWAIDVSPAQFDELVDQITRAVDAGTPAELAALTVTTVDGAALLAEAMIAQAVDGGKRVAREAGAAPAPVDEGLTADLTAAAQVATAFLAGALAASAGREALRVWAPGATGTEVAGSVRTHLEQLGDATLRLELGGSIWAAENEGRFATIESITLNGKPPDEIVADERGDASTCGPCSAIDGRVFDTLAEAQAAYPFGGYRDCEGRSRCRGTVRAIWNGDT